MYNIFMQIPLATLKEAFWLMFHKSGQHNFPWDKEEFQCEICTEEAWKEFQHSIMLVDKGMVFHDVSG